MIPATLSPEYLQAAVLLEPGWTVNKNVSVNHELLKLKHPYPYGQGICDDFPDYERFYRFHPLAKAPEGLAPNRQTVAIDLTKPIHFDGKCRNMIRKAEKAGLDVMIQPGIPDWFPAFYREAMRQIEATPFYLFPDNYFAALSNAVVFTALDGLNPVAAALILSGDGVLEYHLAATFDRRGASNLLISRIAEWGKANGYSWFYLGGGKTPDPDDPLFKFKASFSDIRLPFYIKG